VNKLNKVTICLLLLTAIGLLIPISVLYIRNTDADLRLFSSTYSPKYVIEALKTKNAHFGFYAANLWLYYGDSYSPEESYSSAYPYSVYVGQDETNIIFFYSSTRLAGYEFLGTTNKDRVFAAHLVTVNGKDEWIFCETNEMVRFLKQAIHRDLNYY
jgi:hypothetical protein